MNNLEEWLKQQVECGEPTDTGSWYGMCRDDFPFGYILFHFNDEGKLTGVQITNEDDTTRFAEYYEKEK